MSEPQLAPSWDGSVVLDIGGDIGALVLRTPSLMAGREIDLTLQEDTSLRTHSAVRERRMSSGTSYAAVYPSLRAGSYTVEGSGQRVTIVGGRVTDVELSHNMIAVVKQRCPNSAFDVRS
jgi:hypothetical protein